MFGNNAFASENINFVKTFSSNNSAPNKVWVGTFQLVWNDFMNDILKAPIKFLSGSQKEAKLLNKQEFTQDMLSQDSYYKTYGKTSLALKGEIENAIMEKFGEKSDILDKIDWNKANGAYFLYVMLKKDFDFLQKFNQMESGKFGSTKYETKYFGIGKTSKNQLYKNVKVLFFNNPEDFAVELRTQSNDVVMLYSISSMLSKSTITLFNTDFFFLSNSAFSITSVLMSFSIFSMNFCSSLHNALTLIIT